MSCALRKAECLESKTCTWVVGKGCKKNAPKTNIAGGKKCYKLRKAECLESKTCTWVVGKGCNASGKTMMPNILSNKNIVSLINNDLAFVDRAAMLKAKNSKSSTLQVINISTHKESIPSYFTSYVKAVPIAKNSLALARSVVIVVGSYHNKKFLVMELQMRSASHIFSIFDDICVNPKSITFFRHFNASASASTGANLDMHKSLLQMFDVNVSDQLKQQNITSFQPRAFQKKTLNIKPVVKFNKYVFNLEGATLTLIPVIETVGVDPKTEAVKVNGFTFNYVIKVDKKLVVKDDKIKFKGEPVDVTPYWSKAFNASSSYLNNLTKKERQHIVLTTMKGTVTLATRIIERIDTEAVWNHSKPGLLERPILVMES